MDASTTDANIANIFGRRKLYNPSVGSDHNSTHRSTEDDPLPGGHFLFEGQVDCMIRWMCPSTKTRRMTISGMAELPVPSTAVVGETEIRAPAHTRIGWWAEDGGWILLAIGAQDATRAEHEALVQRSEQSVDALQWITDSRGMNYWTKSGKHSHARVNLWKENIESMPKELLQLLQPRRHACSYRIQGSLCHVWLPL
jgi:hypothetical protein